MSTAEAHLQDAIRRLRASTARIAPRDGDDLVQEALARALAHGVAPDALPWLRTVTRRLAIDRSRRAREVASGGSSDLDALDGVVAELPMGPEEMVLSREAQREVRRALATLPPRYREALIVYAETGDAGLVADRFQLSSNATHTLLCRARERLRGALERGGFVPSAVTLRFQRWAEPVVTGAMAVGLAVTVALGPTAPPVAPPAPQPEVAEVALAPVVEETVLDQASVDVLLGVVDDVLVEVAEVVETPTRRVALQVEVGCRSEDSDGVYAGVSVENGERRTALDTLTALIPERLKERWSEDCQS